jgi:hypothetical protein
MASTVPNAFRKSCRSPSSGEKSVLVNLPDASATEVTNRSGRRGAVMTIVTVSPGRKSNPAIVTVSPGL